MNAIALTLKFAVYVDYTTTDPPRAFYVGKGTQWRCNDRRSRNHVYRQIRKLQGMCRKILFETDNEDEAYVRESELIKELGTFVQTGGANLDFGGQGGPSKPKTPEHREKIRRALSGKKKSDQHRKAMSLGGTGKILTEQHKEKIRKSTRIALKDPEIRRKQSEGARRANLNRWQRLQPV